MTGDPAEPADGEFATDQLPVDQLGGLPVLSHTPLLQGSVWRVVGEDVDLGAAGVVRRQFIDHPGAVGILALDEHDRVLLIRQYRHPVRAFLWELPAGLLDDDDQSAHGAAARELAEEADLTARRWHVLLDVFNSPGGMNEAIRIFLARDLAEVPVAERHVRGEEELDMQVRWLDLDRAKDAVLTGRLHNPTAIVGILAACAAREQGWTTLRPADSPWPEHPRWRPAGLG